MCAEGPYKQQDSLYIPIYLAIVLRVQSLGHRRPNRPCNRKLPLNHPRDENLHSSWCLFGTLTSQSRQCRHCQPVRSRRQFHRGSRRHTGGWRHSEPNNRRHRLVERNHVGQARLPSRRYPKFTRGDVRNIQITRCK